MACKEAACPAMFSPSSSWRLKINSAKFRRRVTRESFCRREPAAALRGFLNVFSPFCSCCSTKAANDSRGIYTSPRTIVRVTGRDKRAGKVRMVRRLAVTSSPVLPSPRVAPRTSSPFWYSSATDSPSILGSTTYTGCGTLSRTRWSNARTSSSENTSCKLARGTSCCTGENRLDTSP